jgi:hypothetical protein
MRITLALTALAGAALAGLAPAANAGCVFVPRTEAGACAEQSEDCIRAYAQLNPTARVWFIGENC